MPFGPNSLARDCATALRPNLAEENAANPDPPLIDAVAPVNIIVPLFFMYFAASLPTKNPANVPISQIFLKTLEVVSSIEKNTLAPILKTTQSMGPDFATSENKLMTCSSSLASEGIAVAEPPDSFISSQSEFNSSECHSHQTTKT